jgi:DNA-binding MarR family transcriptional regulator/GNAT superfamily N-acetyltransferase
MHTEVFMETSLVEQVRSFNRTMTERVGVLTDHFLGRNHPLGEARLLWEIGTEGASIRDLRCRLSLDSAYVSRLLRSLEKQRLVVVRTSEHDGRVRIVQLTKTGQRERAELDQRADAFACSLLSPLSENQREKLATAMAQVERLLIASMVQISVADPTSKDAQWCIGQYFTELSQRFEMGFDPARSRQAHAHELAPPAGLLLVAHLREEPVGCGGLRFYENAIGEIKRMWVEPQVRSLGLGRRLLEALEHEAREAGVGSLRLETNRTLIEAIQLYRDAGYQEVAAFDEEAYAHYWFEKRL